MPGGPRRTITSLAVLAKNEFRQADGTAVRTTGAAATLPQPSSWPTPNARDWKDSGPTQGNRKSPNLGTAVHQWPTPKSSVSGPDFARAGRARSGGHDLATAVAIKNGATGPGARATKDGSRKPGGQLNPTWVEWLMGFPIGWTDLGPSETPSSPR